MKRDIAIKISLDPQISGYSGYDEWTIENLENEQIDVFLNDLETLVKKYKGFYTGIN